MSNVSHIKFYLLAVLTFCALQMPVFAEEKVDQQNSNQFNPKPASASLYNLGLKSYEQGDIQSAISFFKRAVELDPNFVDAYYNLGAIYKKQKNYPQAINVFQKAYDISPNDNEVTFELAFSYLQEKDNENAKKYFSLIPQNFPRYPEAKQHIDLLNQIAAAKQNPTVETQPTIAGTGQPGISGQQAQLLANTLVDPQKELEKLSNNAQEESIPQKQETTKPQENNASQGQLLVDTLTTAETLSKKKKELNTNPSNTISDKLNGPTGIAKDSKNNIYVANFANNKIYRISPDGQREVFIDKTGINGPVGLAIDGNDNLYIANYNGNSIIKISQKKEVSVLQNNIERPYYLYFDNSSNRLIVSVQGNDSLIEINLLPESRQPITSR